jgi:hypothetical protein
MGGRQYRKPVKKEAVSNNGGSGAKELPAALEKRPEGNKLVASLSVDGLIALIACLFLAVVPLSLPVMCFIWSVLVAAVLHFVSKLPVSKLIKLVLFVGAASGLAFSAYDSITDKIRMENLRAEEEGARVEIEEVQFGDVGKSDADFPFFNFYFKNNGHVTALGVRHRFALRSVDGRLLTTDEIEDLFKELEKDRYVFDENDSVPAGNGAHFSEPNARGDEQRAMDEALPDVRTGKSVLYLLEVTWYRDKFLGDNIVYVSEYCEFRSKNLNNPHVCRMNKVHKEKIN